MIIFILQNSLALLSTYLVFKKYFNFSGIIDSLLAFFILFYAQIIFILTLLGGLGMLNLSNIILFELIILLSVIVIAKTNLLMIFKGAKNSILNLSSLTLVFTRTETFCLSVIVGFAIVKIVINLVNPPFGWDDLNYHFTFPVEWLKHGNLVNPIIVNDYLGPTYYPINGSLIFFWFILPFRSVFLADLGQVPFFVIAFLSVFSISRKFKVDRIYSLFAAALFTITPNYFKQLEIAYVDVIVAALFLSGMNFSLIFYKHFDKKSLILFSICIGMLAGTKIIALPHVFIAFLFFLYFLFRNQRRSTVNKIMFFACLSAVFMIIFGGFSYLRNFILTGNPFYPIDVKLFGVRFFKGVMGTGFIDAANNDFSFAKFLFHEGVGAGFIIFVIPGIILAAIKIVKKRLFNNPISLFYILIPALYLAYRYIVGVPNVRYLYPWFGICFVIALFGLSEFKVPVKMINSLVFVCFIASAAEIANHQELVISIIISMFLFITLLPRLRFILDFISRPVCVVFFILVFFGALQLLCIDYINNEFFRYETSRKYSGFWPDAIQSWIWLNNNTSANNIAYAGRPVPFPLYGSQFKNNVYYVSLNEKKPCLHAYKEAWYDCGKDYMSFHKSLMEPNNYRGNADYAIWLKNLKEPETDFLFLYSLHQIKTIEFPIEDKWANNNPGIFKLVFTNNTVHIYRIRR